MRKVKSVAEKSVIMRRVHSGLGNNTLCIVSGRARAGCDGRLWGTMTKVGGRLHHNCEYKHDRGVLNVNSIKISSVSILEQGEDNCF